MTYKTIFVPMTYFETRCAALDLATELTRAQDAHLEVMCLGVDQAQTAYFEMGSSAMVLQAAIEESHSRAEAVTSNVTQYLDRSGVRFEVSTKVGTLSGIGHVIAPHARFADLAVMTLPYREGARADDSLILEVLLFEADCPTIVVPETGQYKTPENVVIGWNESAEALNAVQAALPFLQTAKKVHIAIIDPPQQGPERSDPGGALAVYLARHGVTVDIQVLSRGGQKVSERLAQHVLETDGGMLVMGGYGHSRFREAILGGATRDMLEHSKVPVLMAH